MILIFLFWFEEDVISLYNEFNIEKRYVTEKKEKSNAMRKNFYNLNITVRGILLFCDKMPDKKTENPTEILSWKKSLEIMANDAINKLILVSIKKGLIENEKELTVTFVRNKDLGKLVQ